MRLTVPPVLIALLIALAAQPPAAIASAERHIEGLPFVFEHRWGEREDGTQFNRWSAAARLYSSERITAPNGQEGFRWWIAPLFEYTGNIDDFTEWSLLWPAPLLKHRWRTSDPAANSTWTAMLWAYRWHRIVRTPTVVDLDWWLIPLFKYDTQTDGDVDWSLLWPVSLLRHRTDRRTDGEISSTWSSLLGLFDARTEYRTNGSMSRGWHIIPLFRWERDTESLGSREWWAPFPLPLASVRRDLEGPSSHTYIFPWFQSQRGKDPEIRGRWSHGLLPFYVRSERRGGREESAYDQSTLFLFPYFRSQYRSGEARSETTQVLLPWFDNQSQTASGEEIVHTEHSVGILPVTWGWEDEEFDHLHIWPIFFWRPERKVVAFPFVWWGQDYFYLIPLYGQRDRRLMRWDQEAQEMVPRGIDERPEIESTQLLLFPLWWQQLRLEGEDVTRSSRRVLWPLIGWDREGGRITHHRAFPLWMHWTNRPGGNTEERFTTILPPLIWRHREMQGRRLDSAFDLALPLWARYRGWQREGVLDERFDLIVPLWMRWRDWTGNRLSTAWDVVFPLWWSFRDLEEERVSSGLLPLWFREAHHGETRRLSVLWPLLQMRWPDRSAGQTEDPDFALRVGWFLGGYERWEDGDRLIDLLGGPLWQRNEKPESTQIRLLWRLYTRDTDRQSDTNRVAILGRLFEVSREEDQRGMRLLWIPWRIPLP